MAAVVRSGRWHQGDLAPDLSLLAAMPPGPLVLGQRMDPTYRLLGTGRPVVGARISFGSGSDLDLDLGSEFGCGKWGGVG